MRRGDCTCSPLPRPLYPAYIPDFAHTESVEDAIRDDTIEWLISIEECPMERRALERILTARRSHLA